MMRPGRRIGKFWTIPPLQTIGTDLRSGLPGMDYWLRPEEGKILIVLSDGRPNDIIVNRPNSHNPQPYYGEYAVNRSAYEIRKLRSQGVYVLGVFAGREKDLAAEKKIFGRDFAYIRDIQNFSRVTGRYLRRLLEELRNSLLLCPIRKGKV